jgi:hypothetical protein
MSDLPSARLIPKDGADRAALLRGQARDGARAAGRVAWGVGKALGLMAVCGVGIFAIGAGTGRTRSRALDDLEHRMESIRRMNDSIRMLQTMPKIEYRDMQFDLNRQMLARELDLSGSVLQHEPLSHSPQQRSMSRR